MLLVTFLAGGGIPKLLIFNHFAFPKVFCVKCFAGVNFFGVLWFFRVFGVEFATNFAPLHFFAVCES